MFGYWKQRTEKWVKARLSLYIDGQLGAGDKAKVEAHLKDCLACRDELASLRATVEALKQLPLVEAPRSFAIPALKVSPRPVTFYRLRMATVVVSVLLVAVIAGDSLGLFFRTEAPRPLMAPAPAAMPAPQAPAALMAPAPKATPTPALTPAPTSQDYSTRSVGGAAAPGIAPTPTSGAEAFKLQEAPAPVPAPTSAPRGISGAAGGGGGGGITTPVPTTAPMMVPLSPVPAPVPPPAPAPSLPEGAPGKAGIAAVPAPAGPAGKAGAAGPTAERLADATRPPAPPPVATPTPLPSPVAEERLKAEVVQPTPGTPVPSQTPAPESDYIWPVRQFQIALVALVLILLSATAYFWLRGKKEQ